MSYQINTYIYIYIYHMYIYIYMAQNIQKWPKRPFLYILVGSRYLHRGYLPRLRSPEDAEASLIQSIALQRLTAVLELDAAIPGLG